MLKYHGHNLIRSGFIGTVLIALIIAVGLQPQGLISMATDIRYEALFADAGGLGVDNDVTVSGMKVGKVTNIGLRNGDALVSFTIFGRVRLGSDTTAHIRTGTILGQRVLTLEPRGGGRMRSLDLIPISRTSSPYSLSEALGNLTSNVAGTSTETLNQSLDTLSETIDRIAPELGPTFDNLSRLSQSINDRNKSLDELLANARKVTGIFSDRSQQINSLILNSNDLLDVLVVRRHVIVDLLARISAVGRQVSAVVHDNEKDLGPALQKLNSVTAMLEKSRDNIAKILPLFANYETSAGETVSSGFFYQAMAANLLPAQLLQPFLDYAFGFRRGNGNGQPPDTAGPRAEFPFPWNGIPQRWSPGPP
jgi:phospholipid/cholesterol/gamma-HCH transport system substrate-binding protein